MQLGGGLGWGMVGVCCDLFGWNGGYDCNGMPVSCEVAGAVVGCVETLRDMGLTRPGPGLWRERKRERVSYLEWFVNLQVLQTVVCTVLYKHHRAL